MLERLKDAVIEVKRCREEHDEFERSLKPEVTARWKLMLFAWYEDVTAKNPFTSSAKRQCKRHATVTLLRS